MQEEADERVRLAQETTAVEVEEIKGRIERQRAEWEEEAAAARAEIGSAAAKLEEAEQFAAEHEHRAQEFQSELALAQQEHAQQLLKFEQLQMQLDEAEAKNLHQEQTLHQQQEQAQALQARARELEAQVAALESAKRMLELQRQEQVETIALQRQGMLDSESGKFNPNCAMSRILRQSWMQQRRSQGPCSVGARSCASPMKPPGNASATSRSRWKCIGKRLLRCNRMLQPRRAPLLRSWSIWQAACRRSSSGHANSKPSISGKRWWLRSSNRKSNSSRPCARRPTSARRTL